MLGQRHQVYLIARVIPHDSTSGEALYRSLGGFYDQRCYDQRPVQGTRRFINLISQPQNAAVIRFEVGALQGRYSKQNGLDPAFLRIPCPYLLYVLAMAWNFDVEAETFLPDLNGYSVETHLIGSDQESWSQPNDNGITVIDVSDPSNPAYCHVIRDSGIVSGEQYIKIHYPEPLDNFEESDKVYLSQSMNSLRGVRLLTRYILSEVWPFEYLKSRPTPPSQVVAGINQKLSSVLYKITRRSFNIELTTTAVKEDFEPIFALLGCRGFTDAEFTGLMKLLAADYELHGEVLDKEEDLEAVGESPVQTDLALIPSGHREFTLIKTEFPPLTKPLDPDAEVVDLSGRTFTDAELATLLLHCKNLKSVNLSNTQATVDVVKENLTANPTISDLNLLGTSISDKEILDLLANEPKLFYHMDSLLHPVFLSFHDYTPYNAAFWFPHPPSIFAGSAFPALPFFTPQRIIQAFTDYLTPFRNRPIDSYDQHLGLFASACMSYGPRPEGSKWGERFISIIPGDRPRFGPQGAYVLAIMPNSPRSSYAFLRMVNRNGPDGIPALDREFCMGVKDFIDFLVEEGRPAPTKQSISKLIKLINRKHLKRMDADEFEKFEHIVITSLALFEGAYMRSWAP
ncbi:hypothetical protein ONZ45_g16679 [Pleurotus djamor]|nr:hypothetical protein ONZ45_g16679 [Pleurotus djamor]